MPVLLLFYYPVEFIHSRHYCHNDIKAQNILLGPGQDHNAVYLIDFGLACKYKGETSSFTVYTTEFHVTELFQVVFRIRNKYGTGLPGSLLFYQQIKYRKTFTVHILKKKKYKSCFVRYLFDSLLFLMAAKTAGGSGSGRILIWIRNYDLWV